MKQWVKINPPTDNSKFQVVLYPDFINMSDTKFPNGLRLFGGDFATEAEAINALNIGKRVFKDFEEGYAEDRQEYGFEQYEIYFQNNYAHVEYYEKRSTWGKWVCAYTHFDGEPLKPFEYLKLQLHFIDMSTLGYSHGISIGDMRFHDNHEALINHMKEIDTFMFYVLGEYERQSF